MKLFTTLAMLSALATPVAAQGTGDANWPEKQLRLIVPFPAGSSSDVVSRILMQKLGERVGQQVVIENRVGASGALGSDVIAKAQPDGYTLGIITASTHAVAPGLGAKLPYDPVKDFKPIAMVGASPYVLVTYPGLGINSVQELIVRAKAKPGALNYGSAGIASLAHLMSAQFELETGADISHIPYKSSAQSQIDIITGRLDMQFATMAPVLENIRDGKIKALATTGKARPPALADVPTMIEAGVPDFDITLWMALMLPAATPDTIVARLNKEMVEILRQPETVEAIRKHGFEAEPGPAAAVTERIIAETAKWKTLAQKTGIKAE